MPFTYITEVDSAVAKKWLLKNKNNRSIDNKRVDMYAECMSKGTWKTKMPPPIVIDSDGYLINGQHRLMAVIKSGSIIEMKVVVK